MRGPFRSRLDYGFTLIEMLVVVLIMGLLVGLVSVITRPDARGLLRIEAERLAQLLDFAVAESSLTGRPVGWTADGPGYRFWRFREDSGWSEIRDSDLLRERTLPPGMTISSLRVENMRPQGGMRLEFTPYAPPLFFSIELSFGTEHYAVAASANGIVQAVADEGQTHAAPAL
jgi:general secretion pathway protein H